MKCDRESARRRTDTQTDRQTQTDFIICPMLYAIAMGQIIMFYTRSFKTNARCMSFLTANVLLICLSFLK